VDLEFLLQFLVLRDASRVPALLKPRDTQGLLDAACNERVLAGEVCPALREAHAVLLDAGLRCTLDRRPRLLPETPAIGAARTAIREARAAVGL
jgi:glutamate-ammonia-ligase adenylyltransferase